MKLRLFVILFALMLVLAACGGDSTPAANNAQDLFQSGMSALNANDYETAARDLAKAMESSPSLDGYFSLGNAYAQLGQLNEAVTAYDGALNINPNDVKSLANRGVALYRLSRLSEAQEAFKRALELDPQDAPTQYLLGVTYLQAGDLTAAEEALRAALAINPSLPEAHYGMGVLLKLQGKTEEAIKEFETFLAGPPAQDPQAKGEAEIQLRELKAGSQ